MEQQDAAVQAEQHGPVEDKAPPPDEVLQVEEYHGEPTVSVAVDGPVRVQELPRDGGLAIRGVTVKDGPPTELLRADPHRASAVIICGDPLLIAGSEQEIQGGQPGQWPADVPLKITARDSLWAAALGVPATTVTVVQERWA